MQLPLNQSDKRLKGRDNSRLKSQVVIFLKFSPIIFLKTFQVELQIIYSFLAALQ